MTASYVTRSSSACAPTRTRARSSASDPPSVELVETTGVSTSSTGEAVLSQVAHNLHPGPGQPRWLCWRHPGAPEEHAVTDTADPTIPCPPAAGRRPSARPAMSRLSARTAVATPAKDGAREAQGARRLGDHRQPGDRRASYAVFRREAPPRRSPTPPRRPVTSSSSGSRGTGGARRPGAAGFRRHDPFGGSLAESTDTTAATQAPAGRCRRPLHGAERRVAGCRDGHDLDQQRRGADQQPRHRGSTRIKAVVVATGAALRRHGGRDGRGRRHRGAPAGRRQVSTPSPPTPVATSSRRRRDRGR